MKQRKALDPNVQVSTPPPDWKSESFLESPLELNLTCFCPFDITANSDTVNFPKAH